MNDLNQLIQRLCDADIEFVIVGGFERIREQAQGVELFGRQCRVISLDDLIRAKEAMGREKDLLTVKELRAIRDRP